MAFRYHAISHKTMSRCLTIQAVWDGNADGFSRGYFSTIQFLTSKDEPPSDVAIRRNAVFNVRGLLAYSKNVEACRVALWLAVAWWCACVACAAPQVRCGAEAEEDPRAARFCQALHTFLELYAEAAGEQVPEYQALVRDYPQLLDSGMKRQDVVHSFLRFGRR